MNNFSKAQETLLSLLGQNLFSVPYTPASDTDWVEVIKESRAQSVLILAFKSNKDLALEADVREALQKRLKRSTMNNIKCFKNHAYLHSLMTKNNIPYCILKGAAAAFYYSEPLLRGMGDVDFYVHPDDIDRAMEVFVAEGFERKDKNHLYHIVLRKGDIHFEMHFEPISVPYGEVGDIYREYWKDIRESAAVVSDGLTEFKAPSTFHHGLITLAHIQHHLVAEGIGLRHLCDWAVFANSFSEEEFVSIFEERLKRIGLWRFACILSLAASEYIGMPYKKWMGDEHTLARELISDILLGGNFGRKDKQRKYEGMFISDRGKNGMDTNRFVQAFRSLNRIVRSYWKIVERIPLLYPIGWLYFSFRYLFRLITGKRKLDIANTYKQSGKRKEFYKQLRIFEPEV